jgi:hypothetical protein
LEQTPLPVGCGDPVVATVLASGGHVCDTVSATADRYITAPLLFTPTENPALPVLRPVATCVATETDALDSGIMQTSMTMDPENNDAESMVDCPSKK